MNQDPENKLPEADSDPTVSAAYRATATESTPSALDELVLKNAGAAAGYSGLRRFTASWFRPLAFVATLGLSLALLLELTGTLDLQSVESPKPDANTSADFTEMIEASSRQMREHELVRETAIQGLQQNPPAVESQLAGEAARPCNDDQIAIPMTWWQCISDLEEAGRYDDAKAELNLFNKAHPDFEAPELLPSQ